MSSEPPAAASMPREEDGNNARRRRRITYSTDFLLSIGASEACRNKLPAGIDASVLSAMRWHWAIWDRRATAQRSCMPGAAASPGDDDDDDSSSRVEEGWVPRSRRRQRQGDGDDDDDLRQRAREPEASQTSAGGSKSKTCTRFFSTDGCRFGDDCRYLHYLPGDHHNHGQAVAEMNNLNLYGPALTHSPGRPMSSAVPDREAPSRPATITPATVKSRRCKNYDTPEGCRCGDRCYFAHGEGELGKQIGPGSSFKTRLCESFVSSGSCAFGGRCHFAHGENELRKPVAY